MIRHFEPLWNRYALKFAAFTTIDKHGKSQILACSLIARETTYSFVWIFTQFLQAFRQCPRVIITDGDPAMAAAITQIYPSAIHLAVSYGPGAAVYNFLTRKTTLTWCSCFFPTSWSFPCRHMLLIYHHLEFTNVPEFNIRFLEGEYNIY